MAGRKRSSKPSGTVHRFAARLRETRRAQGMTQLDLATAAGISLAYVGRLEAGAASCTIDVLERIAQALAVSVADLLPPTSPPDTTAQLRERVRSLSARLVQTADRETLALAAQFMARLSE
jgi:transcriptional regulator with XRE-family HTH domain